ncbi:MAG: MBL fold metallo-hydrolase, partial [Betaproteobacteria bacterium]|nr:MBL fold metallo-hydrolase [Betaproteobacteria bacterium]
RCRAKAVGRGGTRGEGLAGEHAGACAVEAIHLADPHGHQGGAGQRGGGRGGIRRERSSEEGVAVPGLVARARRGERQHRVVERRIPDRATGQRCERFRADAAIKPGDTIETGTLCWQAQSAPGHDPESLIFFEAKQGLLISADVLWADGFGVIFPELEGESGFEEQAAMLDLIEYLQPRWVFPGHGPAFSDVDQALSSARKRLAAMRVNPAKHAGHALKVLLKFLMLDLEWTHQDALKTHLAQAKLLAACAQRMQMQADEALQWAIDALLAQGHLRAEGPMLRNH